MRLAREEQYLERVPVENGWCMNILGWESEEKWRKRRKKKKTGCSVGREGILTDRKSDLHRLPEARRARAAGEVSSPRLREEFAEARWTSQRS